MRESQPSPEQVGQPEQSREKTSIEKLAALIETIANNRGLKHWRQEGHGQASDGEIRVEMRWQIPKNSRDFNVRVKMLDGQTPGTICIDGNILDSPNQDYFGEDSLPISDMENYVNEQLDRLMAEPNQ